MRSCSRWGLPCQPCYQGRGALLPHRFTLTAGKPEAVCFLWHYPWGHPRRPLAGTVFPWSPDFPPPEQNTPAAAVQPSGFFCSPAPSTRPRQCGVRQRERAGRARVGWHQGCGGCLCGLARRGAQNHGSPNLSQQRANLAGRRWPEWWCGARHRQTHRG